MSLRVVHALQTHTALTRKTFCPGAMVQQVKAITTAARASKGNSTGRYMGSFPSVDAGTRAGYVLTIQVLPHLLQHAEPDAFVRRFNSMVSPQRHPISTICVSQILIYA